MDFDGDGRFSPGNDTIIPGAYVRIGKSEAISDREGSYLLRNIASGKGEIQATTTTGYASPLTRIDLPAGPSLLRGVNLAHSPLFEAIF